MRLMKINRDVWAEALGVAWHGVVGVVGGGLVRVGDSGLNSFGVVVMTSKFHSRCYRRDRLSPPR